MHNGTISDFKAGDKDRCANDHNAPSMVSITQVKFLLPEINNKDNSGRAKESERGAGDTGRDRRYLTFC